jgi:RNA polymerase sigma-70 factor, ECF subfamily
MQQPSREQHIAAPARSVEERRTVFDVARCAWPGIELPRESFEEYLSAVGWKAGSDAHASSLYLCAGCARHLPAAVTALERAYLRPLRALVRHIVRQEQSADEVMQDLRKRLLVGPRARIATYRGTGPLHSWLRVAAERIAVDHRRRQAARRRSIRALQWQLESEDSAPAGRAVERASDWEISRVCERVLEGVIVGLPQSDKQLLHHHFVSGLGIDVLGAMYGVDRSTAARRIHRALERIRKEVFARVASQFGTGSRAEGDNLLKQLYEQFELDLGAILSETKKQAPGARVASP